MNQNEVAEFNRVRNAMAEMDKAGREYVPKPPKEPIPTEVARRFAGEYFEHMFDGFVDVSELISAGFDKTKIEKFAENTVQPYKVAALMMSRYTNLGLLWTDWIPLLRQKIRLLPNNEFDTVFPNVDVPFKVSEGLIDYIDFDEALKEIHAESVRLRDLDILSGGPIANGEESPLSTRFAMGFLKDARRLATQQVKLKQNAVGQQNPGRNAR